MKNVYIAILLVVAAVGAFLRLEDEPNRPTKKTSAASSDDGHGPNGKVSRPIENPYRVDIKDVLLDDESYDGEAALQKALVLKVIDGKTIKLRTVTGGGIGEITVRVLGIDCPESHRNQKCRRDEEEGLKGCDWQIQRGKMAAKYAEKLLMRRQMMVLLECGGKCSKDEAGKELRYIWMKDGRDFGLEMIQNGLCENYGWKYPHPRSEEYEIRKLDLPGLPMVPERIW